MEKLKLGEWVLGQFTPGQRGNFTLVREKLLQDNGLELGKVNAQPAREAPQNVPA